MKTIRDAIHGDMRFDRHEMALVDTATMQRLRGIKQLGTSNLVYPSASHSRLEHSLGTCWVAKRMIEALVRQGHPIPIEDRRVACLAALLHDITHVPFGHTFEDERRLLDRHDEDPVRLAHFLSRSPIAQALDKTGLAPRVREVLEGSPLAAWRASGEAGSLAASRASGEAGSLGQAGSADPPFVRQLVKGTVCADLLDYLKRDARHCGLALDYDERLYDYFALCEGQLVIRLHKEGVFRRDALSELVHLLQIRYSLTERVYYHHAKVVAGAMISRALELALVSGAITVPELYELRDDSLMARLALSAGRVQGLEDLLGDLASRQLYKRVYLLAPQGLGRPGVTGSQRDCLAQRFHHDSETRRRTEREIAGRLGIPEAHVIIYCPSAGMALKEADVPVEAEPGRVQPLSALGHPDVAALADKHQGLWRFYVCLRRDHQARFTQASQLCEELIGHANQLEPQQRGRLAFGARNA